MCAELPPTLPLAQRRIVPDGCLDPVTPRVALVFIAGPNTRA